MHLFRKVFDIVLLWLLTLAVLLMGAKDLPEDVTKTLLGRAKTTIRIWYSDSAITDWLNIQAVAYSDAHFDIRVEPVLVSGVEMLENINQSSLSGEAYPDLYITTNDVLEKASLAGLTTQIPDHDRALNSSNFCEAALNAVTYKGHYVAYPLFYETSVLLYNRTYLENAAIEQLRAEGVISGYLEGEEVPEYDTGNDVMDLNMDPGNGGAGEETDDETDEETESDGGLTDEQDTESSFVTTEPVKKPEPELLPRADYQAQIDEKVYGMIPKTIADLLTFADNYNAPAEVEGVFKWDVTDIFYNYFIVGNYMNAGGPSGDDITQLDLYNSEIVSCMKAYQKLNTYFAIDAKQVSYDRVVSDFLDGKMVFTVATSDMVSKIRAAQAEGQCAYEYGATQTPDLNPYYTTRTMSVTDALVVNGYSQNMADSMDFARYLVGQTDENCFKQTGRLGARSGIVYEDDMLPDYYKVYSASVPLPKMIETSNFWLLMEIAFTNIWNGSDPNMTMKDVSEAIMKQVVGRHYEEMLLPEPDAVSITDEVQKN